MEQTDHYHRLTEGLPTKSEKIRAMARHGVPTAEIARFLGIRYQHARNVLMAEGLHKSAAQQGNGFGETAGEIVGEAPLPVWTVVSADGTVKLPPALMMAAGLAPGCQVFAGCAGGVLELLSQASALARAQQIVAKYVPEGVSLSDELIADRRREVLAEEAKWKRLEREAADARDG